MASRTQVTDTRRAMKVASRGRSRKNALRNRGSTAPDLALDKPNANEIAQKAAKEKRAAQ